MVVSKWTVSVSSTMDWIFESVVSDHIRFEFGNNDIHRYGTSNCSKAGKIAKTRDAMVLRTYQSFDGSIYGMPELYLKLNGYNIIIQTLLQLEHSRITETKALYKYSFIDGLSKKQPKSRITGNVRWSQNRSSKFQVGMSLSLLQRLTVKSFVADSLFLRYK